MQQASVAPPVEASVPASTTPKRVRPTAPGKKTMQPPPNTDLSTSSLKTKNQPGPSMHKTSVPGTSKVQPDLSQVSKT